MNGFFKAALLTSMAGSVLIFPADTGRKLPGRPSFKADRRIQLHIDAAFTVVETLTLIKFGFTAIIFA